MPRLENRIHERFAWLIAEGMPQTAAYAKLVPHTSCPQVTASQIARTPEFKTRVAEIREIVNVRAVATLDFKRDLLRRMIEGEIPTKVVRGETGKLTATFDKLAALKLDLEVSGEMAPKQIDVNSSIELTFDIASRNTPRNLIKNSIEVEVEPETRELPAPPDLESSLEQYAKGKVNESQVTLNAIRTTEASELEKSEPTKRKQPNAKKKASGKRRR